MVTKINTKEEYDNFVNNGITFVDYYADWCGPCRMMAPTVDELSEEIEGVNFIKVNVDEFGDIAMALRISTIPRFYIFKDGEIKKMFVGGRDKEELKKAILECKM